MCAPAPWIDGSPVRPVRRTSSGALGTNLAFCNGVFHHIPPAQRPGALDYIRRSLKPGGLFALWENNPWNPGTRYVMSRIPFDSDAILVWPRQARALLRTAGFDILRTDFLFVFPRALRSLRGFEASLSRLPLGAQVHGSWPPPVTAGARTIRRRTCRLSAPRAPLPSRS